MVAYGTNVAEPAKGNYATARDIWFRKQVRLREQAQEMYGPAIANLLFDRTNINLIVDRCGVLVQRDATDRGQNCTLRLENEVTLLTARQDALNKGMAVSPGQKTIIPKDFTSSLNVANTLLERVAACKAPVAATPVTPRFEGCSHLKFLQFALNLRVNLLGMSQDSLSDALAQKGPDVQ